MDTYNPDKLLVCPFGGCSKSFTRKFRLEQHKRSHTKERPFVCEEEGCTKSYSRQQHLTRHQAVSHGPGQTDIFPCSEEDCPFTFSCKTNLDKHLKRIHEQISVYKCCDCEESFHKKFQLRHHQFTAHKGVLPFQCEICLKRFNQTSHLNVHRKKHQGFNCTEEDCDQHFDKWSSLRKHKALDHKKGFPCDHCSKVLKSEFFLKEHAASHNDNGASFPCLYDGCSRAYTAQRNLNAHVRSFHQGKKFPCPQDECSIVLASKQKLQLHQRKMHATATEASSKPIKRKLRVVAASFSGMDYHSARPKGYMELLTSGSETETKQSKRVKLGVPEDAIRLTSESETATETRKEIESESKSKNETAMRKEIETETINETETKSNNNDNATKQNSSSRVTPQEIFKAMFNQNTELTSESESETHLAQGLLTFISQPHRQRGSGSD